jgi:hypothetical protein
MRMLRGPALAVGLIALGAAPAFADATCARVVGRAIAKASQVPKREHETTIQGNGAVTETDIVDTLSELRTRGSDGKGTTIARYHLPDEAKSVEKSYARDGITCRPGGSATVDAEPVRIVFMRVVYPLDGYVEDRRYWISRKSGLPLMDETDLHHGAMRRMRYDYRDVETPPSP